jgi:hypothetical protein
MIGDILNDVEAGNRAGCRTIHLDNGNETEWVKGDYRQPAYSVKDLAEAAEVICSGFPALLRPRATNVGQVASVICPRSLDR